MSYGGKMKKCVVCRIALCFLSGSFACSDAFAESYSLTDFLFGKQTVDERKSEESQDRINQKWGQRQQVRNVEEAEDDQEENLVEHRANRHTENKTEEPQPEPKSIPEISQDASINEPIEINEKEMHVLLTAYMTAMIEPIIHDFTIEEAKHCISQITNLFMPGWIQILGY